jgi:ferredoxin
VTEAVTLRRDAFDHLFEVLEQRGYLCVGPVLRDGAIVYDRVRHASDLPEGWSDEQAPGRYRLTRRDDGALFGYAVGPQSFKQFLFPPQQRVWRLRRTDGGFERVDSQQVPPRYAFLGVRACELAALGIQDKVFGGGSFTDGDYVTRRDTALTIAVSCTRSASTCFCASTDTGPAVQHGFDLALTELLEGGHRFVIRAGSEAGQAILDELATTAATRSDLQAARAAVARGAAQQRHGLDDLAALPRQLRDSADSPRWQEVATRCLACANCTLACPTCFCSSVEDVSDLDGEHADRWRRWDSCFNPGFSYLHGGEVRKTTAARYRQWLTHKLGTWVEQFGTSGCVGCGRCIAWCPVGIDIRDEVARLQQDAAEAATARRAS